MTREDGQDGISRRDFVVAGVTAAAVAGLPLAAKADPPKDEDKGEEEGKGESKKRKVLPTRVLGKTGEKVTILNLGATGEVTRRLMNAADREGIRMLDTADCYIKGKHESGLGEWLNKTGRRKEFFVVSKDHPNKPEEWVEMLDKRLKNMQSDYMDLFFIHGLGEPQVGYKMTEEEVLNVAKSKEWAAAAEKMKKSGKTRFVGIALHGEIPVRCQILKNAAEGGWVDAIMLMYDPQTVREHDDFNKALDIAHKAGVGLICMKSSRAVKTVEEDVPKFKEMGLSPHQAVLHAVWTDERIASICSAISNLKILKENSAAARNFKPLKKEKMAAVLDLYSRPGRQFCAGCDGRCHRAAGTDAALNDIVRYLSYYELDGCREKARELFAALPAQRRDWHGADLAAASRACVSKLDFETLLSRAEQKLA